MNNSSLESVNGDYFNGLFENKPSKIVFMTASIVIMLVCVVLCYSIIWYERFGIDAKRTIINQLFSLQCWTAIQFIFFITLLEWLRFMSGPVPKLLCWFHLIIKNWIVTKILLIQTGIIVSRYACIFWLKNPSAFNDEFWCQFINFWVNIFSFIPHFVFASLPGRTHVGYHICIGSNPALDNMLPPKFNFIHYVIGFSSLAIHIPMSIRIYWYKHKRKVAVTDMATNQQNFLQKTMESQTLANFTTLTFSMVLWALLGFLFVQYSQVEPKNFNQYPEYLLVYWIQLVNTPLSFVILLILCFMRNAQMRNVMLREAKDCLRNYFSSDN